MTTTPFRVTGQEPDATILILGITYPGMNNGKVFSYVFVKAGGYWYGTGTGKVPQAAGWGAVERWLADPSRTLVSVSVVTETAPVWPTPGVPVAAPIVQEMAARQARRKARLDTSQASE
jgi:hypothetical protein